MFHRAKPSEERAKGRPRVLVWRHSRNNIGNEDDGLHFVPPPRGEGRAGGGGQKGVQPHHWDEQHVGENSGDRKGVHEGTTTRVEGYVWATLKANTSSIGGDPFFFE